MTTDVDVAFSELLTNVEYLMEEHGTRVIDIEDLRAVVKEQRVAQQPDQVRLALALSEFEDDDSRNPSPRLLARLLKDAARFDAIYRGITEDRLAVAHSRLVGRSDPPPVPPSKGA